MDGTFVSQLASKLTGPEVHVVDDEARLIVPESWKEIRKVPGPDVAALPVATLTGFAAYVLNNRDALPLKELLVHVEGPGEVTLRAKLEPEEKFYRRHAYVSAVRELVAAPPILPFGRLVDVETFIVGLLAGFAPDGDHKGLLELVGSLREENVRESTDDGYAQEVTARAGVVSVSKVKVKNPVTLRPFRTFSEVEQPSSPFVVRFKSVDGGRPHVGLFEADAGAWKLRAIQSIAGWLAKALPKELAIIS